MVSNFYDSSPVGQHLFGDRQRAFGSHFEQQNNTYSVYLPLTLICGALLTAIAPGNDTFVFGSILGGIAGIYLLYDLIFNEPPLRISSLLAMSLLIGYCLGAANSWLTVPRADLTISEAFARDPVVLANGIAACLATTAVLLFAGQLLERPIFGTDFQLNFDYRSHLLIYLGTVLMLVAFATGKIGYGGVATDENNKVSVLGALVSWLSAPILAYSLCATLNARGLVRLLLGGCTILQAVALVPTGRRNFTFALLLAVVASRLGRFRLRLSIFGKVLLLASGAALIFIASIAFIYIRLAGWEHKEAKTLGARVEAALTLSQSRSVSEVTEFLQSNVSTRTFVIGYFADLIDASSKSTPLLGRGLVRNLKLLVPSVVSRDKFDIEPYEEEGQVDLQFGFSYIDEANTILTAGAADFGLLGVFLYPLMIVVLMRAATELVQGYFPTYFAVMIVLSFLFQMLLAETQISDYLIQLRDAAIFALLLYLISLLPAPRFLEPTQGGPLFGDKIRRLIGG